MTWDIPTADNCVLTCVYNVLNRSGNYEWDHEHQVIHVFDAETYRQAMEAERRVREDVSADACVAVPKKTKKATQRKLF